MSARESRHFFNGMQEKICSFFGHREVEITEELRTITTAEIEKSLELGCRVFYFGGYGDFDDLCYQIVSKLKTDKIELGIKRVYCVSQERYLWKKCRYFQREDYDEIIYLSPSFSGWYKSIYFRNCAMIDASDVVIFYAEQRQSSGAYKTYLYAKKKKDKKIVNLFGMFN